jgi:hypothetical protein
MITVTMPIEEYDKLRAAEQRSRVATRSITPAAIQLIGRLQERRLLGQEAAINKNELLSIIEEEMSRALRG